MAKWLIVKWFLDTQRSQRVIHAKDAKVFTQRVQRVLRRMHRVVRAEDSGLKDCLTED
jgi:hypothetical protein